MSNHLRHLAALTPATDAQPAPSQISLISYADGEMLPVSGADHLIWTVEVGKDNIATILMHKHDYEALRKLMGKPT